MKNKKSPLSVRIIFWFANIILGLLALVSITAIVFNIALYTNFFQDDMQLHINLPGKVNYLETGNLYLNNQNIKVELVESDTRIHFFNTPPFLTRTFAIAILIVLSIVFYMVWIFRKFIKNILTEDIFKVKNIALLKTLAFTLLGLWVFDIIYTRLVYYFITANLHFENLQFKNELSNFPGLLFVALFIWVLAHIFIKGIELQTEKELTI